jgi:hypothetical protein
LGELFFSNLVIFVKHLSFRMVFRGS